jgi:ATP-dependent DNA ligase
VILGFSIFRRSKSGSCIAVVVDEQVEDEIEDSFCLAARMLKEIEIRASRIIERDNFAVHHSVLRQIAKSIKNVLILAAERFPPARIQAQLAACVDCQRSVSIELDLVHPEPFDDPNFIFELKHDGFRAVVHIERQMQNSVTQLQPTSIQVT